MLSYGAAMPPKKVLTNMQIPPKAALVMKQQHRIPSNPVRQFAILVSARNKMKPRKSE